MNALNILNTRSAASAHPEQDQALIRIAIAGMLLACVAYAALFDGWYGGKQIVLIAAAFLVFAIAIYATTRLWPAVSASQRLVGIVADVAAITFWLFVMGDQGTILVCAYLFIIIGNDFRHGRLYLFLCQTLCLISFMSALLFAPWWRDHLPIGVGLIVTLVLLPLYVSGLVHRIRDAHLKAEQALKECLERTRGEVA
jgi:two-component system, sensor histidine kinase RpfC